MKRRGFSFRPGGGQPRKPQHLCGFPVRSVEHLLHRRPKGSNRSVTVKPPSGCIARSHPTQAGPRRAKVPWIPSPTYGRIPAAAVEAAFPGIWSPDLPLPSPTAKNEARFRFRRMSGTSRFEVLGRDRSCRARSTSQKRRARPRSRPQIVGQGFVDEACHRGWA